MVIFLNLGGISFNRIMEEDGLKECTPSLFDFEAEQSWAGKQGQKWGLPQNSLPRAHFFMGANLRFLRNPILNSENKKLIKWFLKIK